MTGSNGPRPKMQTITLEQFQLLGALPPHPSIASQSCMQSSSPFSPNSGLRGVGSSNTLQQAALDFDEDWDDVDIPDEGLRLDFLDEDDPFAGIDCEVSAGEIAPGAEDTEREKSAALQEAIQSDQESVGEIKNTTSNAIDMDIVIDIEDEEVEDVEHKKEERMVTVAPMENEPKTNEDVNAVIEQQPMETEKMELEKHDSLEDVKPSEDMAIDSTIADSCLDGKAPAEQHQETAVPTQDSQGKLTDIEPALSLADLVVEDVSSEDSKSHDEQHSTTLNSPKLKGDAPTVKASPSSQTIQNEATDAIESFDDDFDLPENFKLPSSPQTAPKATTPPSLPLSRSQSIDFDNASVDDNWSVHGDYQSLASSVSGPISRRYMASPTPSSTCSALASESDDEAFDDIEFPENINQLMLKRKLSRDDLVENEDENRHENQTDTSLSQALEKPHGPRRPKKQMLPYSEEEEEDDMGVDLIIPDDVRLDASRLQYRSTLTSAFSSEFDARSGSPSKLPRYVLQSTKQSSGFIPAMQNGYPPEYIIPGMSLATLNPHTASSSRVLRRPKFYDTFGDGTELDELDDLEFSVESEARYVVRPSGTSAEKRFVSSSTTRPGISQRNGSLANQLHTVSKGRTTPSQLMSNGNNGRLSKTPTTQRYGQVGGTPIGMSSRRSMEEPRMGYNRPTYGSPANSLAMGMGISHKKRTPAKRVPRKKPTLIRNLSSSSLNNAKTVNGMTWNPRMHRWEGNEEVLNLFDREEVRRPALITQRSLGFGSAMGAGGMVGGGGMVFDPVEMRWIGNEDELDVFGDDDWDAPFVSGDGFDHSELHINSEFIIPPTLRDSFSTSEAAHRAFMSRWYLRGVNDARIANRESKGWLYEIRQIVLTSMSRDRML